jgi:iron-sulfur cluster repair protein YtfE (RIC family)
MDPVLALAVRAGLPDALGALLADRPRAGWAADPGFGPLVRFWLDRHLLFRRLQADLTAAAEAALDRAADPRAAGRRIARLGGAYLGELEGHHHVEDAYYFPRLRALDPRVGLGFDLLDADHAALHAAMAELAERADAALRGLAAAPADSGPTGALHTDLARFGRLLERHLTDEEDLIVPVILKHPHAGLG